MKTKIYLLSLTLSCCMAIPTFSNDKGDRGGNSDGGLLIQSFSRSTSFSPVTLSVIPNQSIDAYMTSNRGVINVTIKNNMGVLIYRKQINTSLVNELSIDIRNYPQGDYTISFKDKNNGTLKNSVFKIE